ncbi:lipoprotein signal peptidase [Aureispira anguillae]|uniref:Lipoprotein signal peptidase n=1 Tax=Aureispira anguillae TaxID=2864201 RepID=A0A915YEN2_9BACT|nr:lipoprotein signal peptidase [Aureispira anguillae]BDS11732.1 lipoprotein signal peptidase [Aureispira anguillae]
MKKSHYTLILALSVLILDQALKIWVKLNMPLGDYFEVLGLSWFHIHFIENPGMAFGIEWGGEYGKLALSLFRIVAISFIAYMLYKLVKQNASFVVLTSITLIFAGAVGNILDSVFYGICFSQSTAIEVATFMPEAGGYTSFLHGKVVDMFYFPLIDSTFPSWFPIWGGRPLRFFEFIFNIADASVFIGTAIIFVFYKDFFKKEEELINSEASNDPLAKENYSVSD